METKTENKVYDHKFFVENGKLGGLKGGAKNKKKGKKYFQWIRSFGTKKKKKHCDILSP